MSGLERWARLTLWGYGSYFACGVIGALLGALVTIALGWSAGASLASTFVVVAIPPVVFLLTVAFFRSGLGYGLVVYYELSAVCITTLLVATWLFGLDLVAAEAAVVGIGVFLVFGRLGCFRVGCCHGRPSRYGIRYSRAHAEAGFASHYVGVPLFPIQLLGSAADLALVVLSAIVLSLGHRPGEVIAFYFSIYAAARFFVEFFRGDGARPHKFGLSEAQWIGWAILVATTIWGSGSPTGFFAIYAAGLAVVTTVSIFIVARRKTLRWSPWGLRQPSTVAIVAKALAELLPDNAFVSGSAPRVAAAPPFNFSMSRDDQAERFGLSVEDDIPLTLAGARAIAKTIAELRRSAVLSVVSGSRPGFYLLNLSIPESLQASSLAA